MNQTERRVFLIRSLLDEREEYNNIEIPKDEPGQKRMLRSLMNVREPGQIGERFLTVQDDYLKEALREKGVTDYSSLEPVETGIYLWQGDITTLKCDAIVNAANPGVTGCYVPCHNCIDNCIHTYAGVQLRGYCADIMNRQGRPEPAGTAKITPAFNLPCKYVIHTVGPVVEGGLTRMHRKTLASCYVSCLSLAEENGIGSIAFCCISTGLFGFPQREAADIAVRTVKGYLNGKERPPKVIFNVFKEEDYGYYSELLG